MSSWQLSCLCWLLSNHSQSGQAAPFALLSPCQEPSFELAVWPRILCDQQAPVSKQCSRLIFEVTCSMGCLNVDPHQMSWSCDLTHACWHSRMSADECRHTNCQANVSFPVKQDICRPCKTLSMFDDDGHGAICPKGWTDLHCLASSGFETQQLCIALLNAVQILLVLNFQLIKVNNMQHFAHVLLLMQLLLHLPDLHLRSERLQIRRQVIMSLTSILPLLQSRRQVIMSMTSMFPLLLGRLYIRTHALILKLSHTHQPIQW